MNPSSPSVLFICVGSGYAIHGWPSIMALKWKHHPAAHRRRLHAPNMPEDPERTLGLPGRSAQQPGDRCLSGHRLLLVPGRCSETAEEFADLIGGISPGASSLVLIINVLALFNLAGVSGWRAGAESILAQYMPYEGYAVAVTTGSVRHLGITGLLLGAWIWLIIAVFIYFGAEQEGAGTEVNGTFRLTGQAVEQREGSYRNRRW
jgi:hypothetical protein